MKRSLFIALLVASTMLVASFAVPAVAQTSMTPGMQNAPARKSPLAEYAGAWIGTFQGRAWMSIRLSSQGTLITGTVQHQKDLQFDNNGELKSVGEEQSTGAVESAVINGDGLLLTVKDPGTQQKDRYLMRLTGGGMAEVKMVAMSMPPGMPKLKPWKLSKVGPSAVTPVR